jgi:hypothetical protein
VLLRGVDIQFTGAVEREVATVEIYTIPRPSLLPAFCAPLSAAVVTAYPVTVDVRAQLPQVHQVQIQSELVRDRVPTAVGSNGTTGFRGSKGIKAAEQATTWMTDARGVPPRGRPV